MKRADRRKASGTYADELMPLVRCPRMRCVRACTPDTLFRRGPPLSAGLYACAESAGDLRLGHPGEAQGRPRRRGAAGGLHLRAAGVARAAAATDSGAPGHFTTRVAGGPRPASRPGAVAGCAPAAEVADAHHSAERNGPKAPAEQQGGGHHGAQGRRPGGGAASRGRPLDPGAVRAQARAWVGGSMGDRCFFAHRGTQAS